MLDSTRAEAIFTDIRVQWDYAEADVKLAEQTCGKIVTPAIKELRYAGRRLVDALNEAYGTGDEAAITALLEDARFNCHCARHDAVDAAVGKMAADLEIMINKLGYEAVLKAYPEFPEFFSSLRDTQEKIARSRRDRANRQAIYESIENADLPQLVAGFGRVRTCEPIMKEFATKAKLVRWGSVAGFAIAFATLALDFFGVIEVGPTKSANEGQVEISSEAVRDQ
ncbi:hypothetical protein [Parvularcula maris]|uniref:Uncharacterized protein n=1 Tax=Parvularcula maris TaxID=2965077 RepID=A0A9X2L8P3_9PROT|nr:hypothetical protein [Parvularcula maris]MCQ8185164.1 hypothetical protein [Parvularcula maris]